MSSQHDVIEVVIIFNEKLKKTRQLAWSHLSGSWFGVMDQVLQIEFFHPAVVAPQFEEKVLAVCAQSVVQDVASCTCEKFV